MEAAPPDHRCFGFLSAPTAHTLAQGHGSSFLSCQWPFRKVLGRMGPRRLPQQHGVTWYHIHRTRAQLFDSGSVALIARYAVATLPPLSHILGLFLPTAMFVRRTHHSLSPFRVAAWASIGLSSLR